MKRIAHKSSNKCNKEKNLSRSIFTIHVYKSLFKFILLSRLIFWK